MKKITLILVLFVAIGAPLSAAELTESFLLGPWCLQTMQFGNEVQDEQRTWVFAEGGSFLMQQSISSDTLRESGSWSLQQGRLEIKPVYLGGHKPVKIISPDKFIFQWMGDLHVTRGSCR